jgi:hypothetical protein
VSDEQALWNWITCAARHAAIDLRRQGGRYYRTLLRFAEWRQCPAEDTDADRGSARRWKPRSINRPPMNAR